MAQMPAPMTIAPLAKSSLLLSALLASFSANPDVAIARTSEPMVAVRP
jgi:hypothetical protein